MSRRFAILLGALSVALGIGAIAVMSTVIDLATQINEYWQSAPSSAHPGDPEFDRMNALQSVSGLLSGLFPWVVLATAIPGIGALLLAVSGAQLAGSASATAARVASSD